MCMKRLKFIKKISIISVSRIRTNIITGYKVKLKYYIDTSEHYGGQSRKIYDRFNTNNKQWNFHIDSCSSS